LKCNELIYSIGKNKIYLVEKEEYIEKFIFSNVLVLCYIINSNFIKNNLAGGAENFLIFEKNGNLLEDLIDDLIIDASLSEHGSYLNVTTATYDDFDECLFMFMQTVTDFRTSLENDKSHLVFYDENHFKSEDILYLIKKYDPSSDSTR